MTDVKSSSELDLAESQLQNFHGEVAGPSDTVSALANARANDTASYVANEPRSGQRSSTLPALMSTVDEFHDSRDSRLLSLPAELRNTIYRYVLVEGEIEIGPPVHSADQPALLQVNRQIRNEAIDIYYEEYDIRWHIVDFDIREWRKWLQSSNERMLAQGQLEINGSPSWANLIEWLRDHYYDEIRSMGHPTSQGMDDPMIKAATQLFRSVEVMHDQRLTWEEVEENLNSMRKMIGAYDARWEHEEETCESPGE